MTVQDAVKIPGNASLDLSVSLESKGVILVGPRGLWNSGLSMSSELLRLRGILSGDFTLSSDCAVPSQV